MTTLTHVSASGLTREDFFHDLTPVTIFTANSGIGKTSRMHAIRLGLRGKTLLGRKQELKGQKAAIGYISRHGKMTVCIQDSEGRNNCRNYGFKNLTDSDEMPETPDILLDSSEYTALSGPDKIREVYRLFPMLETEEFGVGAITAAIKNIRLEENTKETEEVIGEIINAIMDSDVERYHKGQSVQDWIGEAILELKGDKAGKGRLQLARATCDRMTKLGQGIEQIKAAQAQAATARNPERELAGERAKTTSLSIQIGEMTRALERISGFEARKSVLEKNMPPAVVPPLPLDVAATDEGLAAYRKESERLMVMIDRIVNTLAAIQEQDTKRAALQKELNTLPSETETTESVLADIQANETDIERLTSEMGKLRTDGNAGIAEIQKELDEIVAKTVGYVSKTEQLWRTVSDLDAHQRTTINRASDITELRQTKAKEHAEAMAKDSCPHCGASHDHWSGEHSKDMIKTKFLVWDNSQNARLTEIALEITVNGEKWNTLNGELKQSKDKDAAIESLRARGRNLQSRIDSTRSILDKQIADLGDQIAKCRQDLVRLNRQRVAISEAGQARRDILTKIAHIATYAPDIKARAAMVQEEKDLNASQVTVQKNIAAMEKAKADYLRNKEVFEKTQAQRAQLLKEISTLDEAISDKAKHQAILTADRAKLAEVEVIVERLEQQQREFIRAKSDESRYAQALIEHAKAKADLDVTQAAVDVLEDIQSKMVTAAFQTILKTVNLMVGPILKFPVEYHDGELGYFDGGRWRPQESCFSGAEKALTFAGISVALAVNAPIKLVMIDEMGTMDPGLLVRVLENMKQLVGGGVIGQFIGCTSQPVPDMEGVSVIRL